MAGVMNSVQSIVLDKTPVLIESVAYYKVISIVIIEFLLSIYSFSIKKCIGSVKLVAEDH